MLTSCARPNAIMTIKPESFTASELSNHRYLFIIINYCVWNNYPPEMNYFQTLWFLWASAFFRVAVETSQIDSIKIIIIISP